MNELKKIIANGFKMNEKDARGIDLALISLKIALKAFFSTYQLLSYNLNTIVNPPPEFNQESLDANHNDSYCEACTEVIVHFQHFAELVCKQLLRDIHPLLSDEPQKDKHVILYKLLHGISLNPDEGLTLRSIEFSEALERLHSLGKKNLIKNANANQFIINHFKTLAELNTLRNRVLHRGIFILRYPALDSFVGKYILPFVMDFMKLDDFSIYENLWKYKSLKCGIDPIVEIIKETAISNFNIKKIALLKELARAAYVNPLTDNKSEDILKKILIHKNNKLKNRAERIARIEAEKKYSEVGNCPVCGVDSLIIYNDNDYEYDDYFQEEIKFAYNYTYEVVCECCTFNINGDLKNASDYGIKNIEDYWRVSVM